MSRSQHKSPECAAARPARCPRCGTPFDCGRDAKPLECWCASLPPVAAERLVPGCGCLCPRCLAEASAPRCPPTPAFPD
ncbi:MAG TPA: cysteine-rich CWC family protein [Trinickia sp.]|uniref:cysteine-rich CWC family protein n=1 Tax=Trinickia sp. TaxID=2571163 RepID=UPI002F403404